MSGPARRPVHSNPARTLVPAKSPDNIYTFSNLVAVSSYDFPPSRDGRDIFLLINTAYVVSARPLESFPRGTIGLSEPQRSWMGIAFTDQLAVAPYDPFARGSQLYLAALDVQIGFASVRKIVDTPYNQDNLTTEVTRLFDGQMLAPGQKFMMNLKDIPLYLSVKTTQLADVNGNLGPSSPDPQARGLLNPRTQINFFKDPKTTIKLKASATRPSPNAVIDLNFNFESMGIGGLDAQFVTLFRRAFASRLYPPGMAEKIGITPVKGILLHGPPGTGKTLIARQIGKVLNAREPKVVNGPEVLNKFVGQSEENIRKLFADAEKEYKEKGDDSGLHVIIFDELDAVCKQRSSGVGGGTGVGDSVVNQLLTKLDGVDQLNNVLLIGMTNRKDLIDDALLRPGRLELHLEIPLPDEAGRLQIFKIHTRPMRENNYMAADVDLNLLAAQTRNYSGAEIGGVIRAAASYALTRHIDIGKSIQIKPDARDMKVTKADFEAALEEVRPAFGTAEAELTNSMHGGIVHFSPVIDQFFEQARNFVDRVRRPDSTGLYTVCLYGSSGCGKTALASKIAVDSGFPFIRQISNKDTIEMTENQKISYANRVFMDAYKSETSVVLMDDIDEWCDFTPVGPRLTNSIVKSVVASLRRKPPAGRSLLIIATAYRKNTLELLDLYRHFDEVINIPNVRTYQDLEVVMWESGKFAGPDIAKAIAEIRDLTRSEEVQVGIRHVQTQIELAALDADPVSKFASLMSRRISQGTD